MDGAIRERPISFELPGQKVHPITEHQSDFACLVQQCLACASADDFSVAAPSFRTLVPAIAPAFRTVDKVTGMNLNKMFLLGSTWQ